MDLKKIATPVREELKHFNKIFKEELRSDTGLVDTVTRYIVRQKGKKIRPLLVFLTARLIDDINNRTHRAAMLVEILHTATLIHDDVVDQSDIRRGFPSINKIWKNKIAVLMGDYLLSKGLLIALDHDEFYFLKIISNAVRRMSEGELLQIQKSRTYDISEANYFKIISDKTASLIATCCELGPASVCDDRNVWELMREFGENLGIAFQIRDDMLDYIGREIITGKPIGIDVKEKKITLPLIHSLAKTDRRERRKIISIIKNGAKKKDIDSVAEFVEQQGGLDYAKEKAVYYIERARKCLASFPPSPAKDSLEALVDFSVVRTK